jgi:general nucleoside transport system permease protein
MTAATATRGRLDLSGVERSTWTGWGGVALGILAWWIALPPLLLRSPAPSIVLALIAVGLGVWTLREGPRRLGWGAVAAGLIGGVGAVAATQSGEANLERVIVWSALAAAMLRFATPLVFGALGGVISERAGVVNIGLEGMMLMGAFFGIYGADILGGWLPGLLLGMLAGGALALIHAFFAISLRADQIVSGFAVNFIALGITGYVFLHHYGEEGTPDGVAQVPDISLPIGWIPFVGPALEHLNLLVWVALILVGVMSVFLFRTPTGLRVRSVGENPRAAATVGISVYWIRYLAVIASGMLAAMGGAFLSIGFVHSFTQSMTAGRGFIALAVVIVGKWRPGAALAAALLFGFTQALAQRLPTFSESSGTLLQALPYVVTVIAVAGLVGRSIPPAADGVPYSKE